MEASGRWRQKCERKGNPLIKVRILVLNESRPLYVETSEIHLDLKGGTGRGDVGIFKRPTGRISPERTQ